MSLRGMALPDAAPSNCRTGALGLILFSVIPLFYYK